MTNIVRLLLAILLVFSCAKILDIEYKQVKNIYIPNLENLIYTDNNGIFDALKIKNGIKLTGKKPGQGQLIAITTGNKKKLLQIKVHPKKIIKKLTSKLDYSGKKFVSTISSGYGAGTYHSVYSNHNWWYKYMYYKLNTRGQTPFGILNSNIYLKNRDDAQGINSLYTSLRNDSSLIAFGDMLYSGGTSLLIPMQPLQGIRYQKASDKFMFDSFIGKNNYGYWGKTHERDYLTKESISFAKLEYLYSDKTTFGLAFSGQAASFLYKDIFFENYNLQTELALDKESTNYLLDLHYSQNKNSSGKIRFLHIDPKYSYPIGILNYIGYTGIQVKVNTLLDKYVSLKYSGEIYTRSKKSQKLEDYKNYVQFNYSLEKQNSLYPDMVIEYWNNKDMSTETTYTVTSAISSTEITTTNIVSQTGYQNSAFAMKFTKSFLGLKTWLHLIPQHHKHVSSANLSYDKKTIKAGFKYPIINLLDLHIEQRLDNYKDPIKEYNEQSFDTIFAFRPYKFWNNKAVLNLYICYSKKQDKNSSVYHRNFIRIESLINPDIDSKIRIAGYLTIKDNPNTAMSDSRIDEIRVEYSRNFDYFVNFGRPKKSLSGIVYHDDNHNGKLDHNESGVPGVTLLLSNGKSIITNQFGIYKFSGLQPDAHVLRIKDPENHYLFSSDHPVIVDTTAKDNKNINIGIVYLNMARGYVYIDKNNNKTKEHYEKGLAGVRIFVSGKPVETNYKGYYEANLENQSNAIIRIDLTTLPKNLILNGNQVQSSKSSQINFIFNEKNNKYNLIDIIYIERPLFTEKDISFKGYVDPSVKTMYLNDTKVIIKNRKFTAIVPNKGSKLKIKVYTKNKRFLLKYISIKKFIK